MRIDRLPRTVAMQGMPVKSVVPGGPVFAAAGSGGARPRPGVEVRRLRGEGLAGFVVGVLVAGLADLRVVAAVVGGADERWLAREALEAGRRRDLGCVWVEATELAELSVRVLGESATVLAMRDGRDDDGVRGVAFRGAAPRGERLPSTPSPAAERIRTGGLLTAEERLAVDGVGDVVRRAVREAEDGTPDGLEDEAEVPRGRVLLTEGGRRLESDEIDAAEDADGASPAVTFELLDVKRPREISADAAGRREAEDCVPNGGPVVVAGAR